MSFKLSIEQGKGRGQAFDFDAAAITIGRAEENDIVLYDEQGVSRRHARISQADGKFTIEDLESANGTLLNGARVKREALADGDTIGVGAVVFRFGIGKGAARAEDGSTRIVSLTKDAPKTNPRAEIPTSRPAPAAPATAPRPTTMGPMNTKAVLVAVIVAFAAAVLFTVIQNRKPELGGKAPCSDVVDYEDAARIFAFGNNAEAQCISTTKLQFGFLPKAGQTVILSYTPFYIETGEVQIVLNGKKLMDVPLAVTRQSKRQELTLPDSLLQPGKQNILAFMADKGGEWGIDRPELQFIGKDEANAQGGEEAYHRGERLYEQRHVAAPNLYAAWHELRSARRMMEGLDPKPPDYRAVIELISKTEQELDSVCKERLFTAEKETKYGHYDKANEAYQYIFAAFTGDEHPCRYRAQQKIPQLTMLQQQGH